MPFATLGAGAVRRGLLFLLLLTGLLALPGARAWAQNTPPAWQSMVLDIDWPTNPAPTIINASTMDADGNFIIVGTYSTTVTLGTTTFTRPGPANTSQTAAYIAKWNPVTRTYVWALSLYNGFDTKLWQVATSSDGIYVMGAFTGITNNNNNNTLTFGNDVLEPEYYTHFVAKLNDNGTAPTWAWGKRMLVSSVASEPKLAVSGTSVYCAGAFTTPTLVLDGITLTNSSSITSSHDTYVAKLTDNGSTATWTWAQQTGGIGNEIPAGGIQVHNSSVYVTGYHLYTTAGTTTTFGTNTITRQGGADTFVAKLTDNGSTGSWAWARNIGGAGTDVVRASCVQDNHVYLTGEFSGTLPVGSTTLTSTGGIDMFVTRLTDQGTSASIDWAQRGGGGTDDEVGSIAAQGSSVYVGGAANRTPATFGTLTLSNSSTYSLFLARLDDQGTSANFRWVQGSDQGALVKNLLLKGSTVYATAESARPNAYGSIPLPATGSFGSNAILALTDNAPVLTSVNPAAAGAGAPLQLRGFNLTGVTSVQFAGSTGPVTAGFTVNAAGTILNNVVVPAGATTGPVTVTTANGTSNGIAFTVLAPTMAPPPWQLAVQAGTGSGLELNNVVTGADGAVYVSGTFSGTVEVGGTVFSSRGDYDGFVAKWVPATSSFAWAQQLGGGGNELVSSLAATSSGVYVVGRFTASMTLGTTTLAGWGNLDAFVTKLTTSGSVAWALAIGGTGLEFNPYVAANGTSVYVGGASSSTSISFGPLTQTWDGSVRSYLAKLTDAGSSATVQWVQQSAGARSSPAESDYVQAIAATGNTVYLAGAFTHTVGFGSTLLTNGEGNQREDIFVTKLVDNGSSGSFVWAKTVGGPSYDNVLGLAVSGSNVYLTGQYGFLYDGATLHFGGTTLPPSLDASRQWASFVGKLVDQGTTADFGWALPVGGSGVAARGSSVYLAGSYQGTVGFGGAVLSSAGGYDAYLLRVEDAGASAAVAWAQRAGSTGGDSGSRVALTADQILVVGGNAANAGFSSLTLPTAGAFLAAIGEAQVPTLTSLSPASGPVGTTITLAGTTLDGATSVSFNGTVTTAISNSTATGLTVAVPAGTTTGPVTVTTPTGTSNGLTFTLTAPALSVTQGSTPYTNGGTAYDFGTVAVGSTSPRVTFTLTNTGTAPLHITSVGSAGPYTTYVAVPSTIQPGQSNTWEVELTPIAPGAQPGNFSVGSDAANAPSYTVNLTGNATVAAVVWNGSLSSTWGRAANWTPAQVPDASTSVTVPAGTPFSPSVTGTTACNSLTTQAGSVLSIEDAVGAGYLTVHGELQANGVVLMTSGTLETRASAYFNGGLTATGGEVRLMGPGLKDVGRNGADTRFWNLTVGPGTVRSFNGYFVQRVLRLEGTLSMGATVLTLESDATGTAMVVNAGGQVSGLAQMQRYIGGPNAGLGYRHFSSPMVFLSPGSLSAPGFTPVVNPAYNTLGNSVTPFPNFFGFDEARIGASGVPGPVGFDQGWLSPAATTTSLARGRGYTVNMTGAATARIYGSLASGPVAVGALSRSGTGPYAGYHLLGNPYPAPIDWDNVTRPAGMDDAVYVFRSTSQYGGNYDSYVNGVGTLAGGEIASMQGFFVHVSQPVASFTFTDAARLTSYASPAFQRTAADLRPQLQLHLQAPGTAASLTDDVFIYAEAGATPGFDGAFDAPKLPNTSGLNVAALTASGTELAIQGLPAFASGSVIPLTVAVPQAGSYVFTAPTLANLPAGTAVFLTDALTGQRLDLRTLPATGYAFTVAAGAPVAGRFFLNLAPAGALATAPALTDAQVTVFPNPAHGKFTVLLPPVAGQATAHVALLNVLGQVVATKAVALTATGASAGFDASALAKGVYVLRLTAGPSTLTRRVVVE